MLVIKQFGFTQLPFDTTIVAMLCANILGLQGEYMTSQ